MLELIAYHAETTSTHTVDFHGFNDNILLSLDLPPGKYVVHGRLGIANSDGDDQAVSCSIKVRGTLQYVDRIDANLFVGANMTWYALQGVVDVPEGDTLDLTAGSYKAFARAMRLVAFNVGTIIPPV